MTYKFLFFLWMTFFLSACSDNWHKPSVSFYHWKTNMDISQNEMDYLDSLKVDKVYLRFFDVHWNKEINSVVPLASLQWKYFEMGRKLEIIPVIYITNIALENTEYDRGVDTLAMKISEKLMSMVQKMDTVRFFVKELQLDCDWSLETQSKFFRMIDLLKKYLPEIKFYSATIRLHQVKYFTTTGIPPVDKGVLMFYNMGNVQERFEKNSILNLKTAKKYLENFDIYPLKLDVALPLYSWAVQFRENKIQQLINDVSDKDLQDRKLYEPIRENEYKVLKSNYLKGIFVYKNDIIKIENISETDLKDAVKMLKKVFRPKKFDYVFYHLDKNIVQTYNNKMILKLIGK